MPTTPQPNCEDLKKLIREVPDFPKPGILFYDITTLLKDRLGFARLIDALTEHYINCEVDLVLGIEARGFIFGPALAYRLNAGFVPVRKPKKLPAEVLQWKYDLEYGQDTLEIHRDAIAPGQRVIICDDLLATGTSDQLRTLRQRLQQGPRAARVDHVSEAKAPLFETSAFQIKGAI